MGAKKRPFYRIVVADQHASRNGGFIENIGTYDPMTDPETVKLQLERASHWLGVGAQPSEAVARLLKKHDLLDANGKRVAAPQPSAETEPTA
jgi:small subunit ribosomal protein S16